VRLRSSAGAPKWLRTNIAGVGVIEQVEERLEVLRRGAPHDQRVITGRAAGQREHGRRPGHLEDLATIHQAASITPPYPRREDLAIVSA
jgi:hypothetical protein